MGLGTDRAPAPRTTLTSMKNVKLLVGTYLAVAVLTLAAIVLLRDDRAAVTDAVWVRGTIVVLSATLLFAFAVRADRGSRGAYRRVRVLSAVMVVAIAVIVVLPGVFPVWLKVDQVVCGLLLLGVVLLANRHDVRARFATK
jgi:uncharacterized membrane-anchored protein